MKVVLFSKVTEWRKEIKCTIGIGVVIFCCNVVKLTGNELAKCVARRITER